MFPDNVIIILTTVELCFCYFQEDGHTIRFHLVLDRWSRDSGQLLQIDKLLQLDPLIAVNEENVNSAAHTTLHIFCYFPFRKVHLKIWIMLQMWFANKTLFNPFHPFIISSFTHSLSMQSQPLPLSLVNYSSKHHHHHHPRIEWMRICTGWWLVGWQKKWMQHLLAKWYTNACSGVVVGLGSALGFESEYGITK